MQEDHDKENQNVDLDKKIYRTHSRNEIKAPLFSPEVSPINFKQVRESKVDQSWIINNSNAFHDTAEKQGLNHTKVLSILDQNTQVSQMPL